MASNTDYIYVNKDSISERLNCSICGNPLVDPVSTNCQPKKHTFCRLCILDSISHNQSCPICHQQLDNSNLASVEDSYLIDALNELRIKCEICKETGMKRINFNDHLNNVCPKAIVSCPSKDMRCTWVGEREQLDDHLTRCIFSVLRPLFEQLQEQIRIQQTQIESLQGRNHMVSDDLIEISLYDSSY